MIPRALGLVVALALGIVSAPPFSQAQQAPKMARIGFICGQPAESGRYLLDALREGLRQLGYLEGQNIVIEARWAEARPERFPDLITEMVRLKPDMLVIASTPGAVAAKHARIAIPVVFVAVSDPVGTGVVASLARPGRNFTGLSLAFGEGFSGKWLELLKEAVPRLSRAAMLVNPRHPAAATYARELQAAAGQLNVKLQVMETRDPAEIDRAFAAMVKEHVDALVVTGDPLFMAHRKRLLDLAVKHRLPAMFSFTEFVGDGGLMAYGPSLSGQHRRAAIYVDKILKGAKPAELPVEQPTEFEFAINLKTAEALGLTIPQSLVVRADRIIQ